MPYETMKAVETAKKKAKPQKNWKRKKELKFREGMLKQAEAKDSA